MGEDGDPKQGELRAQMADIHHHHSLIHVFLPPPGVVKRCNVFDSG
jgi:hypothetical protein